VLCAVGLLANAVVLALARWMPRPIGHNVRMVLSLAAVDMLACALNLLLFGRFAIFGLHNVSLSFVVRFVNRGRLAVQVVQDRWVS
jgi:hypothetical protein